MKPLNVIDHIKKISFIVFLLVFIVPVGRTVASSYSNLKDPVLLKKFETISEKIMCQCGCNLPLSTCNHRHCGAWALRSTIDNLLLEGKEEKYIIDGFVKGFGKSVYTSAAFAKARDPENGNMTEMLDKGFGESALSEPDSLLPAIGVISIGLLIAGFAILFLRKKFKRLDNNNIPQVSISDEELEKKLNEKDPH